MAEFRKKPVVIEAVLTRHLITDAEHHWDRLPSWFRSEYEAGHLLIRPDGIDIKTLEGTMTANPNDWIICGVQGELYPCKPDIFSATYEAVAEQEQGGRSTEGGTRWPGAPSGDGAGNS